MCHFLIYFLFTVRWIVANTILCTFHLSSFSHSGSLLPLPSMWFSKYASQDLDQRAPYLRPSVCNKLIGPRALGKWVQVVRAQHWVSISPRTKVKVLTIVLQKWSRKPTPITNLTSLPLPSLAASPLTTPPALLLAGVQQFPNVDSRGFPALGPLFKSFPRLERLSLNLACQFFNRLQAFVQYLMQNLYYSASPQLCLFFTLSTGLVAFKHANYVFYIYCLLPITRWWNIGSLVQGS